MKNAKGFTLIELMITLAIIAIIITIGYPMYVEQSFKTRRADAKTGLSDAAQKLERCRTNNNAYNHASCYTGGNSPEGYYTITVVSTASTYTLTATKKAGAAQQDDTKCATFTLAHTGAKSATSSDCW